jgi:hypothetical protein
MRTPGAPEMRIEWISNVRELTAHRFGESEIARAHVGAIAVQGAVDTERSHAPAFGRQHRVEPGALENAGRIIANVRIPRKFG